MTRDEVIEFLLNNEFVDCGKGFYETQAHGHVLAACYRDAIELIHGSPRINHQYAYLYYAGLGEADIEEALMLARMEQEERAEPDWADMIAVISNYDNEEVDDYGSSPEDDLNQRVAEDDGRPSVGRTGGGSHCGFAAQ